MQVNVFYPHYVFDARGHLAWYVAGNHRATFCLVLLNRSLVHQDYPGKAAARTLYLNY